MKKVKDLLRQLRDAWKLLTAALTGILSLTGNAWLVLTVKDWSGQHWYNPAQEIVTSGAATAAILIAIFIYSPEVVKVLAETFLNKRYQAGKEVGEEIGEARKEAQVRKFLEEHPNATAEEVMEFLSRSRSNGQDGATE